MLLKSTIAFSLSVAFTTNLLSQPFYPLEVGNRWDYQRRFWGNFWYDTTPAIDTVSVTVVAETTFTNGKTYYQLQPSDITFGLLDDTFRFVRIDTSNIYYYSVSDSAEESVYRLDAEPNDFWDISLFGGHVRMNIVDTVSLFDQSITRRSYLMSLVVPGEVTMSDKFGPIQYANDGEPSGYFVTHLDLIGCVISSQSYGTPIVSVPQSKFRTRFFQLHQNFPNPFNSTTNIAFSLAKQSDVSLDIFDRLGRLVFKQILPSLSPGQHVISWYASKLPSGVYIYRLSAGEYSSSLKLILIK